MFAQWGWFGKNPRMTTAYVAMGSNLGDRAGHLERARAGLEAIDRTSVQRMSPVYETAAVGGPAGQGPFLNAVAELQTELTPRALLDALLGLERAAGRPERDERQRWGPRPLDLDVLLYDGWQVEEPGLTIPHKRLHERWFVLKPLADLAPRMEVPGVGRTVEQLLAALGSEEAAPT